MTNFSAKILNNSIGALVAQQAVIATTSNNIANVNTPGYARRSVNLETRSGSEGGGISVGNGVQLGAVTRQVDQFVDQLLRDANNETEDYFLQNDFLSRVEALFSLNEESITIGSSFTEFYNALNDLAGNPSSIAGRQNLIERGNDLVNSINVTYNTLADLQVEANKRIDTEVATVNSIASQIANLNSLVASRESSGGLAADERDQRDRLLVELSKKLSFNVIEQSDGQVDITLAKGFSLVSGSTSRTLDVTQNPSFAGGTLPPSLSGEVLSYIVFDYDSSATNAHIDLTQALQSGGGSIGALLKMRGYSDTANTNPFQANGTLVEVASRVEAFARQLLTTVNTTYLGPDEDGGTAGHQPSSADLDGNVPGVYGLFDFTFSGAKDSNTDGLPNDIGTHVGVSSYARLLTFSVSDPRGFAAARDVDAAAGSTSFPSGDGQNISALITTLDANQTFTAGAYTFNGTLEQAYNESVTFTGNIKMRAASNLRVAEGNLVTAEARREEISGVSLDEEFTTLIKSQRAYQSAARMIRVADELMQQIIEAI